MEQARNKGETRSQGRAKEGLKGQKGLQWGKRKASSIREKAAITRKKKRNTN